MYGSFNSFFVETDRLSPEAHNRIDSIIYRLLAVNSFIDPILLVELCNVIIALLETAAQEEVRRLVIHSCSIVVFHISNFYSTV